MDKKKILQLLELNGFNVINGVVYNKPENIISFLNKTIKPTKIKNLAGHKGFDVTSDHTLPIEKDLERRDFTINSIAKDAEGNLIDPYKGIEDIKTKTIRLTNPEAFADDPLRMLRAIAQAARFGFTIEPHTFDMIQKNAD